METIFKKELANHPLSSELQKYYRDITEACVGCSEARRQVNKQFLLSLFLTTFVLFIFV